jgi:hypothetical protein
MSARTADQNPLPLAWPLAGSIVLTALVVAFVCTPPATHLHSWAAVFSRATLYLLVAGTVHALAVWGVCRVRDETGHAALPLIWAAIWTAWIAVVWLPLVALLTAEHSPWVAAVLPLTAVFATLLLKRHALLSRPDEPSTSDAATANTPFQGLASPPLWRSLAPAMITSFALEIGAALLAARHAWLAGCLFCAATLYPVQRLLERSYTADAAAPRQPLRKTAAGNSLVVWLLIVLALVPLMAISAARALSNVLGIRPPAIRTSSQPATDHGRSSGYTGVILVQPKKPHEIVPPPPSSAATTITQTHVIPFDGAYWYFKQPDTRPQPNARIMQGDPVKRHVFSTDMQPLIMEAHQPLGHAIPMNCCRSLRLDVTNADNVPGSIAVEVLLRDRSPEKKSAAVSLGTLTLASSTVSPMPLKRPPVDDHLTFRLPTAARGRTFDEITVRIKPDRSRSLAGTQVAIKDFVLTP